MACRQNPDQHQFCKQKVLLLERATPIYCRLPEAAFLQQGQRPSNLQSLKHLLSGPFQKSLLNFTFRVDDKPLKWFHGKEITDLNFTTLAFCET